MDTKPDQEAPTQGSEAPAADKATRPSGRLPVGMVIVASVALVCVTVLVAVWMITKGGSTTDATTPAAGSTPTVTLFGDWQGGPVGWESYADSPPVQMSISESGTWTYALLVPNDHDYTASATGTWQSSGSGYTWTSDVTGQGGTWSISADGETLTEMQNGQTIAEYSYIHYSE